MLRIDKAILDTNGVICNNISQLSFADRGLLSQNILGQIRNFVEYIAIKAYSNGQDVNPNDYDLNVVALKDMQRRGELRFLYRFHEMLQKSVSHYTVDKDGSERLMLKYYEHLLKIKLYLKRTFNLDVLENISEVMVRLDIGGYVDKTLDMTLMTERDVVFQNRPADLSISVQQQVISNIRSSAASIEAITEADLRAVVDAGANTGLGSVRYAVRIEVPAYDDVWVYYGEEGQSTYGIYVQVGRL
jgi:hypothetical protein